MWLKWKNHARLLPQLVDVDVPVSLYGSGQEYYTLKASGVFQNAIDYDHTTQEVHNVDSAHQFFGFVPYSQVMRAMAKAVASVDLSTKGYTNMTHWEPLMFNTLSMIERRVVEHPDNQIPEDCCIVYDLDNVGSAIQHTVQCKHRYGDTLLRGRALVQSCACEQVVRRTFDWLIKHKIIKRRQLA